MKSQMKAAGRSGARVAVIVGEQEAADGTATVRDLAAGEQEVVPRDEVVERIRRVSGGTCDQRLRPRRGACAPTGAASCAPAHVGQTVSVCGWVARRREHGEHLAFVDLRDRAGVVQCVVDGALDVRSEWVVRVTGTVRARPEGTANPDARHRRGRARRVRGRGPQHGRAAAVPRRRAGRHRRDRPPAPPLRRPAPRPHAAQPAGPGDGQQRHPPLDGGPGLRRDRDADAHRVDARGRPRLRRAVAPAPRPLLRPAAEPAAVQAALHGRRHRPLLPDRPLPARRGPAGRPPVRVHAARRRGQLRRPGRGAGLRLRGHPGLRGRGGRRPRSATSRR